MTPEKLGADDKGKEGVGVVIPKPNGAGHITAFSENKVLDGSYSVYFVKVSAIHGIRMGLLITSVTQPE